MEGGGNGVLIYQAIKVARLERFQVSVGTLRVKVIPCKEAIKRVQIVAFRHQ
jgi:hypothetical protein